MTPNPVVGEEVELPPLYEQMPRQDDIDACVSFLEQRTSQLRSALSQLAQAKKEIEELKQHAPRWREQAKGATHYPGCWMDHRDCCIAKVLELEKELGR